MKDRFTADVAHMMIRMEDDLDCKRRVNVEGANGIHSDDWPCARWFDLRKAYPRVSKPALCMLLERCGMSKKYLETIMDLYETTEYKVKGREGMSEG